MSLPIEDLQAEIYSAITSHADMAKWLDDVVVGDNVEAEQAPVVRLGLFYSLADASTFDQEPMYEGTFTLQVYTPTDMGGTMKLAALMSDLDTAITSVDLIVPNWSVVVPSYAQGITTQPAQDPATGESLRLGILTYSITLEKEPSP